jgi:FkbM family methyltransferase
MPLMQIRDHTFMRQGIARSSVVLDLGAHRGEFSHSMITRFGCRCIAVEANPKLCSAILPNSMLTVVNAAVAAESGMSSFYICKQDEASSLVRPEPNAIVKTIVIPCTTVGELLARHNLPTVDLMKMDIEGAEIDVLESCDDELLRRIPQVTVEFHDFNGVIAHSAAIRVARRFQNLGFDMIRMWMRSYGDTLFINRELASVRLTDLTWSRWAVRNWWWTERFVKRKFGRST